MEKILFLILLGPLLFSQDFQTKDSLKTLAKSNFKSMEVFENKNGKLISTRNYSYDQNKNEITIKNVSEENREWLKTIIKLDNNYNIIEEEKIIEGTVISEKENVFVNKQFPMIKKYSYSNNTINMKDYDSKGKLSKQKINIFDDKNRITESLLLLYTSNDIIIAEIKI